MGEGHFQAEGGLGTGRRRLSRPRPRSRSADARRSMPRCPMMWRRPWRRPAGRIICRDTTRGREKWYDVGEGEGRGGQRLLDVA